jgi:hypothetical protein
MSAEDLMTYANWIVEFGQTRDTVKVLGRFSDPSDAAAAAQRHVDAKAGREEQERIVFDPIQPRGDYCCANGWYRITNDG